MHVVEMWFNSRMLKTTWADKKMKRVMKRFLKEANLETQNWLLIFTSKIGNLHSVVMMNKLNTSELEDN